MWVVWIIILVCMTEWLIRSPQFESFKEFALKHSPKFIEKGLGGLLYCTLCLGFWIGLLCSIPAYRGIEFSMFNMPVTLVANAFLVSVLSLYLDRLLFGIDRHNDFNNN